MTARRAPQIGDLFVVHRPAPGESLYGRVISTTAIVGPTHGCHLVYVYGPGPVRSRDRLLLPPMMTTRAPWSRQYFELVGSEPLLPGHFFECHGFRDTAGRLFDEESRPIGAVEGPVGQWKVFERVEEIEAELARAQRHVTA